MIKGSRVTLKPYTRDDCHKFYKNYVSDEQMTYDLFTYDRKSIDDYFKQKSSQANRKMFGIFFDGEIIGEIQLKYISYKDGFGTLSIILRDDSVKGRGYGSEAEKLLIDYAFNDLGFHKIYADTTSRNTRSKHILLKLGFEHLKDENEMSYYQINK